MMAKICNYWLQYVGWFLCYTTYIFFLSILFTINFQSFFVQAFKIVIDSSKFSMLLLYIWSIPYVSVAFFPSLKENFIAYRSSKVSSRPDCIFEIHQLWQSGFSRVYSNCCCSSSFEAEIIKIGQSSHKMYNNNIKFSRVYNNFKCPYKKSLETYRMHLVLKTFVAFKH